MKYYVYIFVLFLSFPNRFLLLVWPEQIREILI